MDNEQFDAKMENTIEMIKQETDIDTLRDTAVLALFAKEMVMASINEAYLGVRASSSPEAALVVDSFYQTIQQEIQLGNLQMLAVVMGKAQGLTGL